MSADEFSLRVLQLVEEQGSLAPSGDQVWGRDQQMALEAAPEVRQSPPRLLPKRITYELVHGHWESGEKCSGPQSCTHLGP